MGITSRIGRRVVPRYAHVIRFGIVAGRVQPELADNAEGAKGEAESGYTGTALAKR